MEFIIISVGNEILSGDITNSNAATWPRSSPKQATKSRR